MSDSENPDEPKIPGEPVDNESSSPPAEPAEDNALQTRDEPAGTPEAQPGPQDEALSPEPNLATSLGAPESQNAPLESTEPEPPPEQDVGATGGEKSPADSSQNDSQPLETLAAEETKEEDVGAAGGEGSSADSFQSDTQPLETLAAEETKEEESTPKEESKEVATEAAAKAALPEAIPDEEPDEDDFLVPPKTPKPEGAPRWVVTFADLMSLLMCFFVMLLAMSSLELTTFQKMAESMKRGLGMSMSTEMEQFGVEQILTEAQILEAASKARTRKQAAELRQLLKEEITDGKIEVEEGDQQITIQILQAGSFSASSATLKKSFSAIAAKLKTSLKGIPGSITVAGHTDNQPMNTRKFRSNWELSSARAFSVIHSLLKKSDLNPERFVLRGFAETRPRVENNSPQNRAKNRRVEIIVDQRSSSKALGSDNPDNIDRVIINADTINDYAGEHVQP